MNPFNKQMQELIELLIKVEVPLLCNLRACIYQFIRYVPFLKTDYEYLENLDLDILYTLQFYQIGDCITNVQVGLLVFFS